MHTCSYVQEQSTPLLVFSAHSMYINIASVNLGITSQLNWGGAIKSPSKGAAARLTKHWKRLNKTSTNDMDEEGINDNTNHVDLICAQEVGDMLVGAHVTMSTRLQQASHSFAWKETGSFLCGVRNTYGYTLTTEKIFPFNYSYEVHKNVRYMQKADLKDKHDEILVSVINLHALSGHTKDRTSTSEDKTNMLKSAHERLSDARLHVLLGDMNEQQTWIQQALTKIDKNGIWHIEANTEGDFIATKGHGRPPKRFSLKESKFSHTHIHVFGLQVALPIQAPSQASPGTRTLPRAERLHTIRERTTATSTTSRQPHAASINTSLGQQTCVHNTNETPHTPRFEALPQLGPPSRANVSTKEHTMNPPDLDNLSPPQAEISPDFEARDLQYPTTWLSTTMAHAFDAQSWVNMLCTHGLHTPHNQTDYVTVPQGVQVVVLPPDVATHGGWCRVCAIPSATICWVPIRYLQELSQTSSHAVTTCEDIHQVQRNSIQAERFDTKPYADDYPTLDTRAELHVLPPEVTTFDA